MLLYPFPAQSRPAPPRPTGIAERASLHSHLGKPRKQIAPIPARQFWSKPGERSDARYDKKATRRNEPHPDAERAKRRSTQARAPPILHTPPTNPQNAGRPGFLLSDSAAIRHRRIARTSDGGNRGARWEQNGLLTRGAAAACAARYRRVGAADAQSGRGIRDEDGPPPPRVREPRAYQDDRARSCPSRPPR